MFFNPPPGDRDRASCLVGFCLCVSWVSVFVVWGVVWGLLVPEPDDDHMRACKLVNQGRRSKPWGTRAPSLMIPGRPLSFGFLGVTGSGAVAIGMASLFLSSFSRFSDDDDYEDCHKKIIKLRKLIKGGPLKAPFEDL